MERVAGEADVTLALTLPLSSHDAGLGGVQAGHVGAALQTAAVAAGAHLVAARLGAPRGHLDTGVHGHQEL